MTYKTTSFRLPEALLYRAKGVILTRGMKGGLTALITNALEEYLNRITSVKPTFIQAWNSQTNYRPCTEADKRACYGICLTPFHSGRSEPIVTVPDLADHYRAERWDEDTWLLVQQQLADNARNGRKSEAPVISPPEPPLKPVTWAGDPGANQAEEDTDTDEV